MVTVSKSTSDVKIEEIIINDGDIQRSNIETITVRFSRNVNFQELIAGGQITSAVLLRELDGAQIDIEGARFNYDPDTFTLRIDLSVDGFEGHPGTILIDDRQRLFERFGSSEGDELYDYAFDLNEDGQVDAGDYYLWKSRYRMELE